MEMEHCAEFHCGMPVLHIGTIINLHKCKPYSYMPSNMRDTDTCSLCTFPTHICLQRTNDEIEHLKFRVFA